LRSRSTSRFARSTPTPADAWRHPEAYYRERAPVCDRVYDYPEQQRNLATLTRRARLHLLSCLNLLLIAGCGGGGSGNNFAPTPQPPPVTQSDFEAGIFKDSSTYKDLCMSPRPGDPFDMQGTTEDENNWLRAWSNELYLWYDEIMDEDPAAYGTPEYFELMKTFALAPSGNPKDNAHFTVPTDEFEALSQEGITAGYGADFAILRSAPPREVVVVVTEPGSPATAAGLTRGARIISVDGAAIADSDDIDTLNNGLFPPTLGETHQFQVRDLGANATRTINMTSAEINVDPVQFERVFDTPSGPVGYLFFSNHIATAERELVNAVNTLAAQSITDLILDVRYNLGGFSDIANQLAYMIAGPSAASGRTFGELKFSDKHPSVNPVTGAVLAPEPFIETTVGFSLASGQPLPTLNLPRLFVLTGPETCSASEAIMNALRGIDIEVIQIGATTCGKPYGFYAFDNCGTTYFSIQFGLVNAKGFGEYGDGFSPGDSGQPASLPGCAVEDDFGHLLGDMGEARLATALAYRETHTCPMDNSMLSSQPVQRTQTGPELTPPTDLRGGIWAR